MRGAREDSQSGMLGIGVKNMHWNRGEEHALESGISRILIASTFLEKLYTSFDPGHT
jgi:hypothetical protein